MSDKQPELYVELKHALIRVNLDTDGTPLDMHGDRMVEIEPGKWVDAIIAEIISTYHLLADEGHA